MRELLDGPVRPGGPVLLLLRGTTPSLGPADRIATRYDLADEDSHRPVAFALGIDGVLVRGGCVSEDTEDIALRQYFVVVQGKQ